MDCSRYSSSYSFDCIWFGRGIIFCRLVFALFIISEKKGLLPGLAASNDLIARDEGLHFSFSALMFKTIENYRENNRWEGIVKNPELISEGVTREQMEEIVREAVEVEQEFVKDCIACIIDRYEC